MSITLLRTYILQGLRAPVLELLLVLIEAIEQPSLTRLNIRAVLIQVVFAFIRHVRQLATKRSSCTAAS